MNAPGSGVWMQSKILNLLIVITGLKTYLNQCELSQKKVSISKM